MGIGDDFSAGVNVTLHFVLLGRLAWVTSQPVLVPSLGPSSYPLTTVAMLRSNTNHPAACATTLIVALGLMSTPIEVGIIVLSVALLVGFHNTDVDRLQDRYGLEPEEPR